MEDESLKADAILEMRSSPDAARSTGATCALLTPAIKAKLREMHAGQVLEVRVDDPTAREDLASWCRLSGNELLAAREVPPGTLSAFVRKKAD
jgi:tRNA 2-thiouridine synthesizing protein A